MTATVERWSREPIHVVPAPGSRARPPYPGAATPGCCTTMLRHKGAVMTVDDRPRRRGRRPSTTRDEIARVAFDLFEAEGFDETTVDDIAQAVGIARRTLFRYFPSKNDIVWGDFQGELRRLERHLAAVPEKAPLMPGIRQAVVATNDFTERDLPELRLRMRLLTHVPTLQAYSTLRYQEWREVIAGFAAERRGVAPDDLFAQSVGFATLGVTLSAFLTWVRRPPSDLAPLLDQALIDLERGFAE
jgi:TetR/AcrR family transcriptional regulator, regulator of mycofactocin system